MTKSLKKSGQDERKTVKKGLATKRRQEKDNGSCSCIANYVMIIILVFGLTFFHLKQFKYKSNFISVSGSGELSVRHFVNDLNAMICQDYKVSSTWNRLDVYLTSGEARVDKKRRNTVERSGGQLYPNSIISDNSFYLLEGSNLKVNACRLHQRSDPQDQNVDLLIFKGDNSWKEFKSGSCSDCAERNTSLPLDAYCDDGRESVLTYTVSERDTYFIVVVKRSDGYNTIYLDIRSELKISKTTFDTEGAKRICTQTSECLVPLSYDEDVDVVLTFPDDPFITTKCQFRVIFFIGIFVVLPACLLIVGFTCCGVCAMLERQEKKSRKKKQVNISTVDGEVCCEKDKSGLVKNELPPSYDSLNHV